jgi:SAM-dependent methyltransferase
MSHDPELFAGTAQYYARYRPPYPAELFGCLIAEFGLDGRCTVLDLGCGTGQLALPLSRNGIKVWAVDPDSDMIAEGYRAQTAAESGNIRWLLGRGEDIRSMGLPAIRLCTMGASFHWMDRDLVVKALEEIVEPEGGIALVSGSASIFSITGAVEGAWLEVTREVVTEFLGPQRRAGRGTYDHPQRTHEHVLRDSAFDHLQTHRFTSTRRLSIDDVIGQQLSTSYASPGQLGDRLPQFRSELARRLRRLDPDGTGFDTVEHTDLIVARR